MKIGVVGANSYIARNLVKYLEDKGDFVSLYDYTDKYVGDDGNAKHDYCKIDFSNPESINKIDFSADAIFFFIGLTGPKKSVENYETFINVNEVFFLHFLRCYVENKSNALIVYPSSRLIYDSSFELIEEEDKKCFKSIYAITKYSAEKYLEIFNNLYGLNYCVFRICVPYGTLIDNCTSYGTYELFVKQAKQNKVITLFGKGNSLRTFTSIEDICAIFYLAVKNKALWNQVFNMGGHNMTLFDLANIIAKKYEATIKFVDWPAFDEKIEVQNSALNSSKLDKVLNYKYKRIE